MSIGKKCSKVHFCKFDLNDSCTKGEFCHFLHTIPKIKSICKEILKEQSKTEGISNKLPQCKFFLMDSCAKGKSCRFSHDAVKSDPPANNSIDEKICCICMDKPSTHATVPCGHKSYCETCALELEKCAKCREPVLSVLRIFD